MNNLEIVILATALAMDCFTVSIAYGMARKKNELSSMIALILLFGIFQGGMTLIGWLCGTMFSHIVKPLDHWIAFILLGYLGGKMLFEGMTPNNQNKNNATKRKQYHTAIEIISLSLATSIDALAVGITFAFLGFNNPDLYKACIIIGVISSLFTIAGLGIGFYAGKKIHFRTEIIGGIILICIGTKILIEHLSET